MAQTNQNQTPSLSERFDDWRFGLSLKQLSSTERWTRLQCAMIRGDSVEIRRLVKVDPSVVFLHLDQIFTRAEKHPTLIASLISGFDLNSELARTCLLAAVNRDLPHWVVVFENAGFEILDDDLSVPKQAGRVGSLESIRAFRSDAAKYIALLSAIVSGHNQCALALIEDGIADKNKNDLPLYQLLYKVRGSLNDRVSTVEDLDRLPDLDAIELATLNGRIRVLDVLLERKKERSD